jgi:hypothetical protein
MEMGKLLRDDYEAYIANTVRPIVISEVNRILCQRGLNWDCAGISDDVQKEHEKRLNGHNK